MRTFAFQTRGMLRSRHVIVEAETEQEAAQMAAKALWPKMGREFGVLSPSPHLYHVGPHTMTIGPIDGQDKYQKRRTL